MLQLMVAFVIIGIFALLFHGDAAGIVLVIIFCIIVISKYNFNRDSINWKLT